MLGICFVNLIVGVTVLIISASNPAEPRCGVVGKAMFLGECPDVAALEKIVDFLCSAINVKNDGLSGPNIQGKRCQGERVGRIKISAQCDMIKIATTAQILKAETRSEEQMAELQSFMQISYAGFT